MSKLTEVLKLFCYDPETDGNLTFNVTEALTKNWEKIDAALDPLGGATTPQAALAALGAGVQDNDLINPFFEINQRGVTEWTGGYGVDCWTNTENKDTAKITVGSDGEITLTSTVSKDELGCVFSQFLEKFKPGAIKTMSFMGSVISGTAWLQLANDTKQDYTCQTLLPILNDSIFSYTFQIPPEWNETDKVRYTIYQTGPGVVKIKAAKKEPGYKQTLGYKDSDGAWHLLPQPESDYATQLAKCQRYLYKIAGHYSSTANIIGTGYMGNSTQARIFIPLPTTMSLCGTTIKPTIEFGGNLTLRCGSANTDYPVTDITPQWEVTPHGINVFCTVESNASANDNAILRLNGENSYLLIDATL